MLPALFNAGWAYPIDTSCKNVRAYRSRLNARPSFARCIVEARPFPLDAADRD